MAPSSDLAGGLRLGYRTLGPKSNPTILQIHGTGTGHRNYDLLSPLLAHDLRVYDIDLPGYGESEPRFDRREVWDFALDVVEFIEASKLRFCLVHGTSFGGAIALAASSLRPDLIDRLVISCSFGRLDRAGVQARALWKKAAEWEGAEALAAVTSVMGFSRSFWERSDAVAVQEALAAALKTAGIDLFLSDLDSTLRVDLEMELPQVHAATLLIGADEDIITPVRAAPSGIGAERLNELVPSSHLVILENCGHFVSLERAAELADLILRWGRGFP